MTMARTTLLDLPTELLDKVFSYLDWDRSSSLIPTRPDILSVSLTCRHLRQTILPIVFRDVTLKLRWVDGALVEPALLRIRRQLPQLAKYVRCVYIETHLGQLDDSARKMEALGVPLDLHHWIDHPLGISDPTDSLVCLSHQQRVRDIARNLFEETQQGKLFEALPTVTRRRAQSVFNQLFSQNKQSRELVSINSETPDIQGRLGEGVGIEEVREIIAASTSSSQHASFDKKARTLRLQLEAFIIISLCLPPSVNLILFESTPSRRRDTLQNTFAINVAAMAINIFGDRLRELTMITIPPPMDNTMTRSTVPLIPEGEHKIITGEVLGKLETLRTLTLANHNGHHDQHAYYDTLPHSIDWHRLNPFLVHLELWNIKNTPREFCRLIQRFTSLQSISLNGVTLDDVHFFGAQPVRQTDTSCWLNFVIELRRLMPELTLRLHDLRWCLDPKQIPASGIRWLLEEAVPTGYSVDFDRETRLKEDFDSFLTLWCAEDSQRGDEAREQRRDGKLVDAAMCSRWRTFENSR